MGSSLTWEVSIPLKDFAEAAVASKMVAIAVFIVGGGVLTGKEKKN